MCVILQCLPVALHSNPKYATTQKRFYAFNVNIRASIQNLESIQIIGDGELQIQYS
jgi:hypothetical protein